MITAFLTGNFGNNLAGIISSKCIAKDLGYEWGVDPSPKYDYHNGIIQTDFFDLDYGMKALIRSFYLSRFDRFLGFEDSHQPQPFLKSTFKKFWNKEKEYLTNVSKSKFRSCNDINQYFFRYWQLLEGNFVQASYKELNTTRKYKNIKFKKDAHEVVMDLESQKYHLYCINDGFINDGGRFYRKDDVSQEEFLESKNLIIEALRKIFPDKSSFEL